MSIAPGSQLGPYEILSPLGAGGMGEVYKARDTRLDRIVAVKVLPEHLSNDSALRERFEREARAVSSLNHPHICTLHDVGEEDGVHFLVMEHIEGETLADRLKKGPLPFELVLEYASQIANALDEAHRAGIVHRDLKPGNVMLTKPGVKLLDFGLAQASPPRRSLRLRQDYGGQVGEGGPDAPTQQKPLTDAGTILGTVQYMAPEQLEGKEVDARADLFALGAVLFEMLTGKKAFQGESQASLISAIMSTEPPPVSPPALDRVVKKCLAKDPDDRWHCAHDLVTALQWTTDGGQEPPTRRGWPALALVAPALLLGGLITWFALPNAPDTHRSVKRFDIALAPDEPLRSDKPALALSADGSRIAYATTSQLYLRPTDAIEAVAIPDSDDACCPFFSPDGEWLGFFTTAELKKVSVAGGAPVGVASVTNGRRASWSADGDIVISRAGDSQIFRVSATGGTVEDLASPTGLATGTGEATGPKLLPDEDSLMFAFATSALNTDDDNMRTIIVAESLTTGERKTLIEGGANPYYAPTGHLVYNQDATLWAVPFDLDRLEVTGEPFLLVEGLMAFRTDAQFSFSEDGTLIYAGAGSTARMVWVERDGHTSRASETLDVFRDPRISPDGERIAVSTHPVGRNHDIWIYNVERGIRSRLTTKSHSSTPVWTPDGSRIVFASRLAGVGDLFWKPVDSRNEPEPLHIAESTLQQPSSWHPDGNVLAFEDTEPETARDIWLLPSNGEPAAWLATSADEFTPRFSPDGSHIAYVSNETGQEEVYVTDYPDGGTRTVISTDGGREPAWSADGRELFYRSNDGNMMLAVPVSTTRGFSAEEPTVLFEGRYFSHPVSRPSYDVTEDGQRFVMIQEEQGTTEFHVVLNWFEELKRLDPNNK